jgi:flagellin
MSLGVLNNLSAVYAENNLTNTNNSLSKTLQQLSSGSKINSGADDAAGLSLVDGLQANQQALTQSQTNAQEGVGLLQVADGALSQVTTLLNRAVTLATEASNGTLNSSQDTAANQEYQSILSEISKIGSTTTYNNQAVFNSNTNIYTGDSSTAGSAIDALNIRSLSSSNVGDSGGTMAYSTGANNAFIDLSNGGTLATSGDELSGGTDNVDITYMTAGNGGAVVNKTAVISVGGATGLPDTAQGLINAINNSGLGVTATFTTAAQAGTVASTGGKGADTGIEISGLGSGVAGAANGAGAPGINGTFGAGNGALTLTGGTMTINGKTITLGGGGPGTVAALQTLINGGGYGVYMDANFNIDSLTKATITTSGITGTGSYTAGTYYTAAVTEDTTHALFGYGYRENARSSGIRCQRHGRSRHHQLLRPNRPIAGSNRPVQRVRCSIGVDGSQHGHHRCGGAGRLRRRANQHAERRQPGHLNAAGKRAVGAKRSPGHRLRAGQLQHVEVRNPEPDRHFRPGAGQQRTAGSYQAPAVIGVPSGGWLEESGLLGWSNQIGSNADNQGGASSGRPSLLK